MEYLSNRVGKQMFKKSIFIFTILILLWYFCLPKYTVEVCRRRQFVVDRDFVSMRKSLSQGHFEEEILRANNATVIQKSWINTGIHVERPLQKDRYWEFSGVLQAKVGVNDSKNGQMTVDLQHKVLVASEQINLETTLIRPLEVGVTDLRQKIHMKPYGNKTFIKVEVAMRLHRFVPYFMQRYARESLMKAVDRSADTFEVVIKNLPSSKSGLKK